MEEVVPPSLLKLRSMWDVFFSLIPSGARALVEGRFTKPSLSARLCAGSQDPVAGETVSDLVEFVALQGEGRGETVTE